MIKGDCQGQRAAGGKAGEALVEGSDGQVSGRRVGDVIGLLEGRVRGVEVVVAVVLVEAGDAVGGANDGVLDEAGLPGDADTRLEIGDAVVLLVQGRAQTLIVDLGSDQVAAKQFVVDGVVVLRGAGSIEFPTQAVVNGQVRTNAPSVLTVDAPKVVADVAVAGAGSDAQVIGQAEKKIGEARAVGERHGSGGGGRGRRIAGVLAVEVKKPGQPFATREEEVVAVIVELNANVKFVIAVGLYDRVADLENGVGESVELAQIVGDGGDIAKQAANGRKKSTRRARNPNFHRQIRASCIGKTLADREITEPGTEIVDEAGTDGSGPTDDAVFQRIAEISDAVIGQEIGFSGGIAHRLLGITAEDAVFVVGGPVNLDVALVGIIQNALLIEKRVEGGVVGVRGAQWIERRIHDIRGGRAQGEAGGGQVIKRDGNASRGCHAGLGRVQLSVRRPDCGIR